MSTHILIVIIFLRLFSALPFAIYYSSLQLYLLNTHLLVNSATSIVGSVLALSYGSALVGGCLAGRYISYRAFFVFCLICQAIGCLTFTTLNPAFILWFSSLFLLGSAGIAVCINMMVTQCYEPNDQRREKAFFWLYMSLNIGYLVGYSLSGYYGNLNEYTRIPLFVLCCTLIAIFLTFFNWRQIDKPTLIYNKRTISYTLFVLAALLLVIRFLLQFPAITNVSIIITWTLLSLIILLALLKNYAHQQQEIIVFYVLLLAALVFWSIYFLAPMALMVFMKNHVLLTIFNSPIAPQWIQNINTLIIILGTIILGAKTTKQLSDTRKIIRQFPLGLFLIALGFAVLTLGIFLNYTQGKIALGWIALSYLLQSLGELLIGPIGYALVGRLMPKQHHSFMMGIWVTLLGAAGAIASKLSTLAPHTSPNLPASLARYQHFFTDISIAALLVAAIIYSIGLKVIKPKLIYSDIQ